MSTTKLPPIHPGEILLHEFMRPMGISINGLSRALHVPPNRIGEIVNERRGITADTALRLARHFNTTAQFWLNLQTDYDLDVSSRQHSKQIERDVQPLSTVTRDLVH